VMWDDLLSCPGGSIDNSRLMPVRVRLPEICPGERRPRRLGPRGLDQPSSLTPTMTRTAASARRTTASRARPER
jgi:hypothetical protein